MPYRDADLWGIIGDWWAFGAFIGTALIGFFIGRERQRWRVDQIGQEVQNQGHRITILETQGNSDAVQLAKIISTQTHILEGLHEIKASLQQKVDKL